MVGELDQRKKKQANEVVGDPGELFGGRSMEGGAHQLSVGLKSTNNRVVGPSTAANHLKAQEQIWKRSVVGSEIKATFTRQRTPYWDPSKEEQDVKK